MGGSCAIQDSHVGVTYLVMDLTLQSLPAASNQAPEGERLLQMRDRMGRECSYLFLGFLENKVVGPVLERIQITALMLCIKGQGISLFLPSFFPSF